MEKERRKIRKVKRRWIGRQGKEKKTKKNMEMDRGKREGEKEE